MNDSTTAGAAFSCCFAEAPVDAEAQNLRHSEAEGRGIPYGGAKRCIIVTHTNQRWDSSVASLPLNDVQEVSAALGAAWIVSKGTESALPWTRKPKVSVIQRGTQYPVESPMEGQRTPAMDVESSRPPPSSPRSGDPLWRVERYDVVTPAEPYVGFPCRARE